MERYYLPMLCEVLAGMKPGRAIDIGPGWGTMSVWLANHGWRVTAMDRVPLGHYISAEMIFRLQKAGARINYLQRDLFAVAPDIHADLILMSQVIPHLKYRPDIAIRNAARMLRAGGTFLCVTLDREANPRVKPAYGFDWRVAPLPGHRKVSQETVTMMFDRDSLESLLVASLGPCEVWRPEGSTCLFGRYLEQ